MCPARPRPSTDRSTSPACSHAATRSCTILEPDTSKLGWLRDRGIALIRGHGRIAGERCVRVDGELLRARRAVAVAVGSAPARPPIPGLDAVAPWTNREAVLASRVPPTLIVLGGGPVGVEFAAAFASLGARVTLIEAQERLLPSEEDFAGKEIGEALVKRGVDLRLGIEVRSVSREDAAVRVELSDGRRATGAEIVLATGRRPLTDDLGLETVGLEAGAVIEVDAGWRARGLDWLYAIGDVNGTALLTHEAKRQARAAAAEIAGERQSRPATVTSPPRVVFTDPQLAAVGLTLARARELEIDAHAYDVPTSGHAPGASFHGRNAPGTSRIVVDEGRGIIVGATFVGFEVSEWLHAATIAITAAVPIEWLWDAVPAFPTRSEVWLALLQDARSCTANAQPHASRPASARRQLRRPLRKPVGRPRLMRRATGRRGALTHAPGASGGNDSICDSRPGVCRALRPTRLRTVMSAPERLGHNEAVFRDINERIEAGTWISSADEPIAFACECAALRCNVLVELTVSEYESVRAHPRRFLLAPGHELASIEVVVYSGDGYVVVEKQGEAAAVAEASDPR